MQRRLFFPGLILLLAMVGCESVNPAGTAGYENPEYPSSYKGKFYCGQMPFHCAFAPLSYTVWVSEPANRRLFRRDISKALVNPHLSDTMYVHFSPGLIAAPSSGEHIYVSEKSGIDIYAVNTVEMTYERVYTATASIYTMKLSGDSEFLYLGSQGTPWMVEAVSTTSWQLVSSLPCDWPVYRLEVSPNDSLVAIGNSGREEIVMLEGSSLAPLDTLEMPMRIGTMAFSSDSRALVVLDASSGYPHMIKVDLETGEHLFSSRPYHSYLINAVMHSTNTLLLPRNQDYAISVLNIENMIFAPSIPTEHRVSAICVSHDNEYIVALSKTSAPGRLRFSTTPTSEPGRVPPPCRTSCGKAVP